MLERKKERRFIALSGNLLRKERVHTTHGCTEYMRKRVADPDTHARPPELGVRL